MDENILGLVAGGITSVAMLPQLIKVLKEKDVKDLSFDRSFNHRTFTLGLVRLYER